MAAIDEYDELRTYDDDDDDVVVVVVAVVPC